MPPPPLTATMSLHLRAPPGGVGAAATLGGPFEDLAEFIAAVKADTVVPKLEREFFERTAQFGIK